IRSSRNLLKGQRRGVSSHVLNFGEPAMRNRRLPLTCGLSFSATLTIVAALRAPPVFAQGLTPEPLPLPPTPAAVVDGWIAAGNETAIRDHAWALWAAANSPSKSPPW